MKNMMKYTFFTFLILFLVCFHVEAKTKKICQYKYDNTYTYQGANASEAGYSGNIGSMKLYVGYGKKNEVSTSQNADRFGTIDNGKIDTNNCQKYICAAYRLNIVDSTTNEVLEKYAEDNFQPGRIGYNKFYIGKCDTSYEKVSDSSGFGIFKTNTIINYKLYQFVEEGYVEDWTDNVTMDVCLKNLSDGKKCITFSRNKDKKIEYDVSGLRSNDDTGNKIIKITVKDIDSAFDDDLGFQQPYCHIDEVTTDTINMTMSFKALKGYTNCQGIRVSSNYIGVTPDSDISGDDYISGCSDLPKTTALVKQIYGFIKYLIPVLVIGLSIVDFLKVLLNGEEKVYKDAWSKFVKRIIIGIVILLLPILLKVAINISGVLDDYNINNNNIFCILS